jgi:hypothetical protein
MEFLKTVSNTVSGYVEKNPGYVVIALSVIFAVLTINGIVWMYKNRPSVRKTQPKKTNVFLVLLYVVVWFISLVFAGASINQYDRNMKSAKLVGGLNIDVLTDTPF